MCVADLHVHSTASDGLLSPIDIVAWGIKKKLKAISITDHDSIAGLDAAINNSKQKDIEIIPGVELSTEFNSSEIHLLGYFIDYKDIGFNKFLNKLKESRKIRAEQIVKKLNNLGYGIRIADVYEIAKNASSIGRPHIARVLVNLGYCKSIEEAFDKFIGFGKPAYVERYKISPFQAVEVIKKCGGVSSIAHPGLINNVNTLMLIKKLKEWGLLGIEVYHTRHSEQDTVYFGNMAKELNLIPTGGTDCHGVMINNEPILGNVTVPYENVMILRSHRNTVNGSEIS